MTAPLMGVVFFFFFFFFFFYVDDDGDKALDGVQGHVG